MHIGLIKKIDGIFGQILVALIPRPSNRQTQYHRVLFVRPGGIGDAVLLVPVINFLAGRFPHISIDVLAEKRNSKVFALCSTVSSIFCYDQPKEFFRVLLNKYDVVVDTEQWHRLSAVISRLTRSKKKIGFATNDRRRMFTDVVDYSHDDYELKSFLNLLSPLDCDPPNDCRPPFLDIPSSVKTSEELLAPRKLPGSYVVLFPGASVDERKWGAGRFAELASGIGRAGLGVVVVGGKEDIGAGAEIKKKSSGVFNLAGKTSLLETASLLRDARLLVSGDSGVLHLGVGLGIPTVSLFGPGIAKKWAPRGKFHRVVNLGLPCSPCTKFGTTPACPIGSKCIQDISVETVFNEVMDLLSTLTTGE